MIFMIKNNCNVPKTILSYRSGHYFEGLALLPPKVYMSGSGWTGELWHITSPPDLFSRIIKVPPLIAMYISEAAYRTDIMVVWF
jgi:hypothetical protein